MIELLALAMALEADRLVFATAGRLTSLDDPIPPVTDGADLRQRTVERLGLGDAARGPEAPTINPPQHPHGGRCDRHTQHS